MASKQASYNCASAQALQVHAEKLLIIDWLRNRKGQKLVGILKHSTEHETSASFGVKYVLTEFG